VCYLQDPCDFATIVVITLVTIIITMVLIMLNNTSRSKNDIRHLKSLIFPSLLSMSLVFDVIYENQICCAH
jgi:hypothetical protein